MNLTIAEREQVRRAAEETMRKRLDARKPDGAQYATGADDRAGRFIASTLTYAKAAVPVIAVLAAIASAIRTMQVTATIYAAAGSHPVGVAIAALAFTAAAEGALFTLALAAEGENMRRRAEKRTRHVTSFKTLAHALLVRLGMREPARYDELPDGGGGLGYVMLIAFLFTLSTNLYLGLKPLIGQLGAASLQDFLGSVWTAAADLQMTFIVDTAAALFAPLMALNAGHLTARFAAEIAQQSQAGRTAYERDLASWRDAYADPLATSEGNELLQEAIALRQQSKAARIKPAPVEMALSPIPLEHSPNGNGHSKTV